MSEHNPEAPVEQLVALPGVMLAVMDQLARTRRAHAAAVNHKGVLEADLDEMTNTAEWELVANAPDGIKSFGSNEAAQRRSLIYSLSKDQTLRAKRAELTSVDYSAKLLAAEIANAKDRLELLQLLYSEGVMSVPESALGHNCGDITITVEPAEAQSDEDDKSDGDA